MDKSNQLQPFLQSGDFRYWNHIEHCIAGKWIGMWHLMVYVTGFERDSCKLIIILCWSRRYMMSTLNLWWRKDTVKPISDTKPAPPQPGQGCISPENIYTTVWLLGLAPLGTEDKQSNWYLLSTFHIMEISYIYFSTQVFSTSNRTNPSNDISNLNLVHRKFVLNSQ